MKVIYCREEFGYSFEEFGNLLFPDEIVEIEEVTNVLTRLKRVNVISKVRAPKGTEITKADLSDIDNDAADIVEIDPDSTEILYKFKFVGLIIVKTYILYSFPKYIEINPKENPTDKQIAEFKQIIKVIEKYSKSTRKQAIYSLNEINESVAFGDLSVSLFLLEDYFQNGLYSHQHSIVELNGEGEILWDKTVNESFAFFSDSRPVYIDYFNRRSVVEDDNFIKKLHEVVLSRISETLELNGLLDLLDLTSTNITDVELTDLGDIDYILYMIESELSQEYNTRKQLLLKALYSYVSQKYEAERDEYASLFGTNSFHGVWEKACTIVLNDKLNVTIGGLGLEPIGENTKNTKIKYIIDKPQWAKNKEDIFETATLIPDIITVVNNRLLILDGKYYNLRFSAKSVAGNPGVGDVTKQLLYALAYREFADKNNLEIVNYFLMPTENDTILDFAQVEMQLLNNLGLSSVKVAKLNAANIYQKYLNDELDRELLSKF
ncbi:TPA: LlaJI family restriction endonuclease [Streptococcus suis]|nr:LlaJI family restriction endonuclease [Streptococcus suis]HEM5489883.1 LlaJI family restriction endonuclease [Streptococcus suis]